MMLQHKLQVAKARVSRWTDPDLSPLMAGLGTGLVILAFGSVWFVFLRGLTALGRMLMVWHFYI